jgi:hypothetical protein
MCCSLSGSDWEYKSSFIEKLIIRLASKTHFKILSDGTI